MIPHKKAEREEVLQEPFHVRGLQRVTSSYGTGQGSCREADEGSEKRGREIPATSLSGGL